MLTGVGPDAPVVVNERGGKQSQLPIDPLLQPVEARMRVNRVFTYGANKYGRDNWRNLSAEEHLKHMQMHIDAYLAGDTQDDHLGHAACRLLMAIAQEQPDTQARLAQHVNMWAAEWHKPEKGGVVA